ncbi:hypothetical protein N9W89_13315, partial [Hellea sp.]|nr:hypothetical protein [Hellea sp.]
SIIAPLMDTGVVTVIKDRVEMLEPQGDQCSIITQSGETYIADDVLLAIGHQPTRQDAQMKKWTEFTQRNSNLVLHAGVYPVSELTLAANKNGHKHVAIRGYGLSMIDAARALGELHGSFEADVETGNYTYTPFETKLVMAPFSLDGMTMGPKPHTPRIDAQYAPPQSDLKILAKALSNEDSQKWATGCDWLIDRMVPTIAKVFESLKNPVSDRILSSTDYSKVLTNWLSDSDYSHESIMPNAVHPSVSLQSFIDMAMDTTPIYLDYCAGQVWRHCQMTIYASLSHSKLSDDVMADIITLDERLKRYSFGPPVASLKQLKALYNAGALNLDVLSDPDITCDKEGWTLKSAGAEFTATTMIDSVLDGPKLIEVISPLLASLLDKNFIQPVHDELGVQTDEFGYVLSERSSKAASIAILGRIAKGTVIGVDAILECFGERPKTWADKAVKNMSHQLSN